MPSADEWERQIEAKSSKTIPSSSSNYRTAGSLQEPKQGELDNPAFIWPGATARTMNNKTYQPVRGYIRRLNEFYARMGDASDIKNRRCNFQFQPESFERTVDGNSVSTQFFFNQDPGQLTVPVPGQSSYTLKLLFNREAEVASGTYIPSTKGGSTKKSKRINTDAFDMDAAQKYMTADYDKSWVCEIGVLADIFVLDSIIGQGINKETISTLQNIVDRNARNAKDNPPKDDEDDDTDDQDKKKDIKTGNDYWSANSGDLKNNPNIGNTAFLVPSPVRIMLSNLIMVEGFVTQSSVNIHKFTSKFIPTQATVTLQIQALYIGFSKKQTMLTSAGEGSSGDGEDSTAEPDLSSLSKTQRDLYDQLKQGTEDIYKDIVHDGNNLKLINVLTPLDKKDHVFNFSLKLTENGTKFVIEQLERVAGAAATYAWNGTIKMWWHSHVSSNGTRGFGKINAPAGYSLVSGAPSDSALVKWGTKENPLTLAESAGILNEFNNESYMVHTIGEVSNFSEKGIAGFIAGATLKYINNKLSNASPAVWPLFPDNTIDSSIPRPFLEDKFTIQLSIDLKVTFNNTTFPVSQVVKMERVVACDEAGLLLDLKISKA